MALGISGSMIHIRSAHPHLCRQQLFVEHAERLYLAVEGPLAHNHSDLRWVAFLNKCCSRGGSWLVKTGQYMACYNCWAVMGWG